MAEHTPGPWCVDARFWVSVDGNPDRLIADIYDGSPLSEGDRSREDEAMADANARLIAAAPDLLEALVAAKGALLWATGGWRPEGTPETELQGARKHLKREVEAINVAIAKARGQAVAP